MRTCTVVPMKVSLYGEGPLYAINIATTLLWLYCGSVATVVLWTRWSRLVGEESVGDVSQVITSGFRKSHSKTANSKRNTARGVEPPNAPRHSEILFAFGCLGLVPKRTTMTRRRWTTDATVVHHLRVIVVTVSLNGGYLHHKSSWRTAWRIASSDVAGKHEDPKQMMCPTSTTRPLWCLFISFPLRWPTTRPSSTSPTN